MKKTTALQALLAVFVASLMSVFPLSSALAGSNSVESGGYQFFPKVRITAPNLSPALITEQGGKICTSGIDVCDVRYIYAAAINQLNFQGYNLLVAGTTSSAIAAGSYGFKNNTEGAYVGIGPNANQYLYADSTYEIRTPGDFRADSTITTTTVLAAGYTGSNAGASASYGSSTSAATASSTVPAIKLSPGSALDTNDLILDVQKNDGTSRLSVDWEGDVISSGDIRANGGDLAFGSSGECYISQSAGYSCIGQSASVSMHQDQDSIQSVRVYGKADASGEEAVVIGTSYADGSGGTSGTLASFATNVGHTSNGTEKAAILGDGTHKFTGVATSSLISAASCIGCVQYDSTANGMKFSNGSTWAPLGFNAAAFAGAPVLGYRVNTIFASATPSYASIGFSSPTLTTNSTGQYITSGNYPYWKAVTSAVSGNVAGMTNGTSNQYITAGKFLPIADMRVMTGDAITGQRIWLGYFNSNAHNTSDAPAEELVAIRYSSAAADVNWMCCAGDGSTTSCTSTGVRVDAATEYAMEIITYSDHITCTVNGTTVTHSTNVPGTSANELYARQQITTLTAASVFLGLNSMYVSGSKW